MDLRLGSSRADGAPRDKVGSVLRRDGIQKFTAGGQSQFCNIKKEGAGETEALVDLEGAVHVRIIDEALPAHGRPWFFKVDSHDDVEFVFGLLGVGAKELSILESGFDVVNRARSDDDE